jgi:hypothetical protein
MGCISPRSRLLVFFEPLPWVLNDYGLLASVHFRGPDPRERSTEEYALDSTGKSGPQRDEIGSRWPNLVIFGVSSSLHCGPLTVKIESADQAASQTRQGSILNPMQRANRVNVINALRVTIHALDEDADFRSGRPNLTELKTILLRRIADLERDDATAANPQTSE